MDADTNHNENAGDRFIPNRRSSNYNLFNLKTEIECESNEIYNLEPNAFLNIAKQIYNRRMYCKVLASVILPKNNNRILNYSTPADQAESTHKNEVQLNMWPVFPRKKPLLERPYMILDMPDLDTNICHNIVDWSKNGYIATIYNNEIHVWHANLQHNSYISKRDLQLQACIKWNREGTHIALALPMGQVCILEYKSNEMNNIVCCKCCTFGSCNITAMEYTSKNMFITGCSIGRICVFNKRYKFVNFIRLETISSIISIKSSCNGKYIAATSMDGLAQIFKVPEFKLQLSLNFKTPSKAIAWHPWNESLLAVGSQKYLSLWNVANKIKISSKEHLLANVNIDCMTFNPLSAELVISYFRNGSYNGGQAVHFLTVLRNLNSIVDQVIFHRERVPYLLWNENGTKLVTGGADENLCIWEFFGSAENAKKLLKNKKKELSTDIFKNPRMFGCCIR